MARCEICSKAGQSGNNISHSKRHTRTRWFANVHRATIYVDGAPRKVNICTRCLRTQIKAVTQG
ncbi:MAG: 50S ribosomal protein L28 [SAR202 cluster bacterium]|nr:50S ribosomal protein L28 [Chloroflexota bacterium]MDP6420413.1 50S ribosomal protein L28 [SAR202 cluster bacterium]HAL47547.1 50S ribosomal protein L28 [Dehalococcoidia bacterium]MDP6662796.1 50S ribosomal protein L28 [SAR202 cluster bacterium]MDP6800209.1 50S ribosomal protein L28 [SAR202 cluster bacterium]